MSPLVRKMAMQGKKGDLIHVPKPLRGTASAKAENVAVTIQANTEEEITIAIDRHFEYSRFIEDIVDVQALSSLRQYYTSDAGYQLALQVDKDLLNCATGFGNGGARVLAPATADWVHNQSFIPITTGTGLTAFAADTVVDANVFNDLAFRSLIKRMDDNNVPMDNRNFVVPPAARKAIMGIDRFVSTDFVTGKPVETGYIGNLYGVDFYVSSNCPVIETDAENTAVGTSPQVRAGIFFHKDAIVHAEQLSVRSQTQYKQEYLSTLYTADTLYGVQVYRPEAGFVLAMADI